MAQSMITQVSRETDSYNPCPAPADGTGGINNGAAAVGVRRGRHAMKREKFGHSWCVCNWFFSCFKKDEPAIGATTFENETLPVPESPKSSKYLLPPRRSDDKTRKCIIIDLDETLVHSSFKPVNNADFIVPVEIDGVIHQVYVLKRPHCDEFLKKMGELFECVLFTASLAKVL